MCDQADRVSRKTAFSQRAKRYMSSKIVQYTSATVPVYANVACPRGNRTQLSTCYDTLIAPLTPIHNGVSSRRISL